MNTNAECVELVEAKFLILKENLDGNITVVIRDNELRDFLREHCEDICGIFKDAPRVTLNSMLDELASIRRSVERQSDGHVARDLLDALDEVRKELSQQATNMIARNIITFDLLRCVLETGTHILIKGLVNQGGVVVRTEYYESFFGDYLSVEYDYIGSNGKKFMAMRGEAQVFAYTGTRGISELNVVPINDIDRNTLTSRGREYVKIANGDHYKMFEGSMVEQGWRGDVSIRSNGRIMVDTATHDQFLSNRRRGSETLVTTIAEENLWMTDAYVWGFSFATKNWGRFDVDLISDIKFNKQAYDQLVLDPEKKNIVKALVSDLGTNFTDVIAGKGGGCIFLLAGEPGVGKTLTAEAIAEFLERPLYSVGVGELGVSPSELEKQLKQILDVAQVWNAVVLIDEADIFLEKRSAGNILRNSMVSIFLKMLEYHNGVMFLTTNRVKDFDPAFYSRISVALHYDKLGFAAREQIWKNLFDAAGISGLNTTLLAEFEVNGRQIKNNIRMAQSLARQEGEQVTMKHINQALNVSKQFHKESANYSFDSE